MLIRVAAGDEKQRSEMYDEEAFPVQDPASKHAMKLTQQNRLEIDPGWCYGRQGPLYLVACAVNSTLYEGTFNRFKAGQQARLQSCCCYISIPLSLNGYISNNGHWDPHDSCRQLLRPSMIAVWQFLVVVPMLAKMNNGR